MEKNQLKPVTNAKVDNWDGETVSEFLDRRIWQNGELAVGVSKKEPLIGQNRCDSHSLIIAPSDINIR
jgi:hypothetical protein